jgi:hypothetical protein
MPKLKGYSKSCWTPRLRLSNSGQDKHAWNEVQRNDRPADTGSLETRTLANLICIQHMPRGMTNGSEGRSVFMCLLISHY